MRWGGPSIAWVVAVHYGPAKVLPESIHVGTAIGLAFPPTRQLAWNYVAVPTLRLSWFIIEHTVINLARASAAKLAVTIPTAAASVSTATAAWYAWLTMYGSAGAGYAVGGAAATLIAIPIRMATTDAGSTGELYTEEIITYEDSITWSPGGMVY